MAFQILPKFGFLVWKYLYIWQPCLRLFSFIGLQKNEWLLQNQVWIIDFVDGSWPKERKL
jgi:hypothetical protein